MRRARGPSHDRLEVADRVTIGFPTRCHYQGGHRALGRRGGRLWLKDGRLGVGRAFRVRSVPLSDVASVEVSGRQLAGSDRRVLVVQGIRSGSSLATRQRRPLDVTDVVVHTKDGQDAVWRIDRRDEEWVRGRLAPVLRQAKVRFTDELPPSERPGGPVRG